MRLSRPDSLCLLAQKPLLSAINSLEPRFARQSLEEMSGLTGRLRRRLAAGQSLDDLVPEAFAAVREAAKRTLRMRHYDEQILGGLVMHRGNIAEMATGEGKTLAATCPLYLRALQGRGAHLITANPYLAKRDAVWMGAVFHALHSLGVRVGIVDEERSFRYDPEYRSSEGGWRKARPVSRREAYRCDITYGDVSSFIFDYLRDNRVYSSDERVQRGYHFAIIDEADSILIDQARAGYHLTGEVVSNVALCEKIESFIHLFCPQHFRISHGSKSAELTPDGIDLAKELFGQTKGAGWVEYLACVEAAFEAHHCYRRDEDYLVEKDRVILVDGTSGRPIPDRRLPRVHLALEIKEGVRPCPDHQKTAEITIQNYCRLYTQLAGMTGTAKTEENEFREVYGLGVVTIPSRKLSRRKDLPDSVFKGEEMKFRGIVEEVLQYHLRGQPVLVGTRSIESSEKLYCRLDARRLQIHAAILLLRDRLEKNKRFSGDRKNQLHKLLNLPIDDTPEDSGARPTLVRSISDASAPPAESFRNVEDLAAAAREIDPGFSLNMLDPANATALSGLLKEPSRVEKLLQVLQNGIRAAILNAKHHEQEAGIIAQPGRLGAVTVATNMAGRGVDIILGGTGHPEAAAEATRVKDLGGLHVIGSERHESRRIDHQLRGRAGRQGDPGSSHFYLSLADKLWMHFGDQTKEFGMHLWDDWLPVETPILSRMVAQTQKKVEHHYFEQRQLTLALDDVLDGHRQEFYAEREKIVNGELLRTRIRTRLCGIVREEVKKVDPRGEPLNLKQAVAILNSLRRRVLPGQSETHPEQLVDRTPGDVEVELWQRWLDQYDVLEQNRGPALQRKIETKLALQILDERWAHHLSVMDTLWTGFDWKTGHRSEIPHRFRQQGDAALHEMMDDWITELATTVLDSTRT